ncbi:MAG: TetR/AcrR family transcriptional regulator [Lachnospiraceae bacterium]|nr:TetR/AcrR family transcriptional regulator [Lachnospiraceae bacterium]
MNTKEQILEEALRQFSRKGFDGTSMSDIAGPLGISKAALYKHFKSKQQIFDRIIEESEEKYKDVLDKLSVHYPDGGNAKMNKKDVDVYSGISAEGLCENVLTFVRFSMSDEYPKQVRRMLTISQFQSNELSKMYSKRYVDDMLGYDEKLFEQLIKTGVIKNGDPKALAAMFYAPVIMYMGIWDREPKRAKECEKAIKDHVEQFFNMTKLC